MEFNKKAATARRALTVTALLAGVTLGSLAVVAASARAGNAPTEIIAKPPCVMQPLCRTTAVAPEEPANLAPMATLDTLALHAALQTASGFGLLQALREPDPTRQPEHKWCKN